MKLTALLPNVAKMELTHPTLGATGITLSLIGQDTKVFRDKAKIIAKSMVGKTSKDIDIDVMERQNLELAASCIVGWTGIQDDDGNELPYSPDKAFELMTDPGLRFLREQVEEFIAERKNFFRVSGETA